MYGANATVFCVWGVFMFVGERYTKVVFCVGILYILCIMSAGHTCAHVLADVRTCKMSIRYNYC